MIVCLQLRLLRLLVEAHGATDGPLGWETQPRFGALVPAACWFATATRKATFKEETRWEVAHEHVRTQNSVSLHQNTVVGGLSRGRTWSPQHFPAGRDYAAGRPLRRAPVHRYDWTHAAKTPTAVELHAACSELAPAAGRTLRVIATRAHSIARRPWLRLGDLFQSKHKAHAVRPCT